MEKRKCSSYSKKDGKQCLKNYHPVSLLPVYGKIFEKVILNEIFKFVVEKKVISANLLGFKSGDSCINHLLPITHELYKSFENDVDVRGVFLDISRVFDKFWYEGLIFKLKQNLNLSHDFVRNKK